MPEEGLSVDFTFQTFRGLSQWYAFGKQWMRNVIVCNCVIMYKLHECNQLPLQLLQQINSQFQLNCNY